MLDQFGWSETLQASFTPFAARGLAPARVTVQQRGLFSLVTADGECHARPSGRFTHNAAADALPVVGDWVAIAPPSGEGPAVIHAVMPRRTALVRRAAHTAHDTQIVAANIDVALLAIGLDGDFNLRRLERYLAAAWQSGAEPVVVLTKADTCVDLEGAMAQAEGVAVGAAVIAVSALTGGGLDALAPWLKPGWTLALLGSSGVGKSTLVNALAGHSVMETGALRENDSRGRHTTTHRELVRLASGALILDSPGMRELGLAESEDGLSTAFEDVEALVAGCRFRDCGHGAEPGCAVRAAIESGELDGARWRAFDKLRRENAHFARREDPIAREAERRRWIGVNKAQRAKRRDQDQEW